MLKKRLIAVIIVNDNKVIQTKNFNHTNIIHYDPVFSVEAMGKWSLDELIIINASKKNNSNQFLKLIYKISKKIFLPLTVGGWVDNIEYSRKLLLAGADKILVNSAFYYNKKFIKNFVEIFGSQCLVASVDTKREKNKDIAYIDRCRLSTGTETIKWCKIVSKMGAGEIFLNSYENDGTDKGLYLKLFKKISSNFDIPTILFGGVSSWDHLAKGFKTNASAVAAANIFHYSENAATNAKEYLLKKKFLLRND